MRRPDTSLLEQPAYARARICTLAPHRTLLTPERVCSKAEISAQIINTVLDRTGLSRSTMYRKMQNGTFPKNVQISTRCAGWRESAIDAWLRNPIFYCIDNLTQNDG